MKNKKAFTLAEVFSSHFAGRRKAAFTLAEVLITLGIIGVVASLTMPTLMTNHRKKVYVSSLQKVYNDLSQAIGKYMSDQRVEFLNESKMANNSAGLREFFTNYLNVVKDCGESYTPCFANTYKQIGNSATVNMSSGKCNIVVTLANGVAVCADTTAMNTTQDEEGNDISSSNHVGSSGDVVAFDVDINGPKEPNIFGRDFFTFQVDRNGQIFDKFFNASESVDFSNSGSDTGAFGKIMADSWQMNY